MTAGVLDDRGPLGSLFETRSQDSKTSLPEQEAPSASGCRSLGLFQQNGKSNLPLFLLMPEFARRRKAWERGKDQSVGGGGALGREKANSKKP